MVDREDAGRSARLGKFRKMLAMDPEIADDLAVPLAAFEWFEERYEVIADGSFNPTSKPFALGDGAPQVCRYCGRIAPVVTFDNDSHAFPELIGNKWLFDRRECDTCNGTFSALDRHFGNWTLPWRALGRTEGKNGVPTYRSRDGRFQISTGESGQLRIMLTDGDPRVSEDETAKSIVFDIPRPRYVPMAAFKCLAKMALAIMPDEEAKLCSHLRRWLLDETHAESTRPMTPLTVMLQSLSGPLPNDRFAYELRRRRPGIEGCPYMVFGLNFWNHIYQITVPMPTQDAPIAAKGALSMGWLPNIGNARSYQRQYGAATQQTIDLSSGQVRKDDSVEMRFTYENRVDVDPTTVRL